MEKTITIRIEEKLLSEFKKLCKEEGFTVSQGIRDLIRKSINHEEIKRRIW